MAVEKKALHNKALLHQDAISSRAKRTPPTGARKAAAIPAADPHVTRSRLSLSLLKNLNHRHVSQYFFDPPWHVKAAMQAPVCTMGPAFPTLRDDDTAAMLPTILTSNVLNENIAGASTPFK